MSFFIKGIYQLKFLGAEVKILHSRSWPQPLNFFF